MKILEHAKIIANEPLAGAQGVFDLRLFAPRIAEGAVPGQFVMVYTNRERLILPRPISLCGADAGSGEIRLVYKLVGRGTASLAGEAPGAVLRTLGPLGNGFPLEEAKRPVIIGGGVGVPPLLWLARAFEGRASVFLGDRDAPMLAGEFAAIGPTHLASDTGKAPFTGTSVALAEKLDPDCDAVFACGPEPMLRAAAAWARGKGVPAYLSLEERMACGLGACVGCAAPILRGGELHNLKVCKDGPVFLGAEVYYE